MPNPAASSSACSSGTAAAAAAAAVAAAAGAAAAVPQRVRRRARAEAPDDATAALICAFTGEMPPGFVEAPASPTSSGDDDYAPCGAGNSEEGDADEDGGSLFHDDGVNEDGEEAEEEKKEARRQAVRKEWRRVAGRPLVVRPLSVELQHRMQQLRRMVDNMESWVRDWGVRTLNADGTLNPVALYLLLEQRFSWAVISSRAFVIPGALLESLPASTRDDVTVLRLYLRAHLWLGVLGCSAAEAAALSCAPQPRERTDYLLPCYTVGLRAFEAGFESLMGVNSDACGRFVDTRDMSGPVMAKVEEFVAETFAPMLVAGSCVVIDDDHLHCHSRKYLRALPTAYNPKKAGHAQHVAMDVATCDISGLVGAFRVHRRGVGLPDALRQVLELLQRGRRGRPVPLQLALDRGYAGRGAFRVALHAGHSVVATCKTYDPRTSRDSPFQVEKRKWKQAFTKVGGSARDNLEGQLWRRKRLTKKPATHLPWPVLETCGMRATYVAAMPVPGASDGSQLVVTLMRHGGSDPRHVCVLRGGPGYAVPDEEVFVFDDRAGGEEVGCAPLLLHLGLVPISSGQGVDPSWFICRGLCCTSSVAARLPDPLAAPEPLAPLEYFKRASSFLVPVIGKKTNELVLQVTCPPRVRAHLTVMRDTPNGRQAGGRQAPHQRLPAPGTTCARWNGNEPSNQMPQSWLRKRASIAESRHRACRRSRPGQLGCGCNKRRHT